MKAGRKAKVAEPFCDRVADAYVQATRLKAFAPVSLQVSNTRFRGPAFSARGMPPADRCCAPFIAAASGTRNGGTEWTKTRSPKTVNC
jgi:hypothetical protein